LALAPTVVAAIWFSVRLVFKPVERLRAKRADPGGGAPKRRANSRRPRTRPFRDDAGAAAFASYAPRAFLTYSIPPPQFLLANRLIAKGKAAQAESSGSPVLSAIPSEWEVL
jgi:hypothetical protein